MKRLVLGILALMLVVGLNGCSSNPGENEIVKSCNEPFKYIDTILESANRNLVFSDYVECDSAKITDSYKKNDMYVLQFIPHIKIKKDFSDQVFKDNKLDPGSLIGSQIFKIMYMMKRIKLYREGKIKKGQISQPRDHTAKDIIFHSGDNFDTFKSSAKFRKTDNGWMEIN